VREIPVDPHKLTAMAVEGQRVFLGGERTPAPKQRQWLHQLLGRLPERERVIMHMRLQEWSQRDIAAQLGISQPAVCWRLKAAHRRLRVLARMPTPPVTADEAREAFRAVRDPRTNRWLKPWPADADILVLAQRMRPSQIETELGLRWPSQPGELAQTRLRAMAVMCVPEAERVRALLDWLALERGERVFTVPQWNPAGKAIPRP
jgi:hypothetical protein